MSKECNAPQVPAALEAGQPSPSASARALNEPELADDYPIYGGYWYVADGKPVRSEWHDITAAHFKAKIGAKVLCRCDIYGRKAPQ